MHDDTPLTIAQLNLLSVATRLPQYRHLRQPLEDYIKHHNLEAPLARGRRRSRATACAVRNWLATHQNVLANDLRTVATVPAG